jgi:F-type H+-transporting ATPase subunit b
MFDEKFWLSVAFFFFLILAIKYVWPKLAKALDDKAKQISEEILAAKNIREKAEKFLLIAEKHYQESITYAEKLMKDAELDAQRLIKESQEILEKEIAKKTSAALDRIKFEEEIAIREIKEKIISSAMESLVTDLKLDQKNHDQLIEKAAQDFQQNRLQ